MAVTAGGFGGGVDGVVDGPTRDRARSRLQQMSNTALNKLCARYGVVPEAERKLGKKQKVAALAAIDEAAFEIGRAEDADKTR